MQASLLLAAAAVFALLVFAFIGGPMFVADWSQQRRRAAVERQVALTDAIDAQLGTMVAPIVRRRLWGPWEVEIALPLSRFAAIGRILDTVDEVFSGDALIHDGNYRVVLTARSDSEREPRGRLSRPANGRLAHRPMASA